MIIQKKVILKLTVIATFAIILLLQASANSFAQDKKYTENDIPKSVLESFNKLYPNSNILGYDVETKDGQTFYEIESKQGTLKRDVKFNESGNLIETEESMNVKDLSSNIVAAINSQYPKSEITKSEKITTGSEVSYEVTIKSKKKKIELVLNSNGEILKTKGADNESEDNDNDDND